MNFLISFLTIIEYYLLFNEHVNVLKYHIIMIDRDSVPHNDFGNLGGTQHLHYA